MRRPSPLHAPLAALLAACVLLLGLAAASPRLHERLCRHAHGGPGHLACPDHDRHRHDHDAQPADKAPSGDACAVTLFAAGCETPLAFNLCPPVAPHAEAVSSFTELFLSRTLRGPERVCGPPARA